MIGIYIYMYIVYVFHNTKHNEAYQSHSKVCSGT